MADINILVVADKPSIQLGAALNILIARKSFPNARFHVAIPASAELSNPHAAEVIEEYSESTYRIPDPTVVINGTLYRIENKLNALRFFSEQPAIFVDSDMFFLRALPADFLLRAVPAAVPEHGLHVFPWEQLFHLAGLAVPDTRILLGSGVTSLPWFNAGFITTPNAAQFGHIWHMYLNFVLGCDFVPEKYPYLDQISLPLAIAHASKGSVTHENVLPAVFNQNLYNWMEDQSFVKVGFVIHHHTRVALIKKYFSKKVVPWIRQHYPIIDKIIDDLAQYERPH